MIFNLAKNHPAEMGGILLFSKKLVFENLKLDMFYRAK
jgi:hypothetical protein